MTIKMLGYHTFQVTLNSDSCDMMLTKLVGFINFIHVRGCVSLS